MKIIFLGTPEFAVNTLNSLYNSKHEVLCVVCQPDKPVGRGGKIEYCAVKKYALLNNIPIYQFEKIRNDGVEILKSFNADCMVTCAYGQILNKELLNLTKNGVINVHGSLLPKYRGAAPIQYSIMNGDELTGITILKSDIGIDDGDMILKKELEILENETSGELSKRLSQLGSIAILEALDLIEENNIVFKKQNSADATFTKMLTQENAKIDFSKDAKDVKNFINAYNPSPISYFIYNNKRFKIYNAHIFYDLNINEENYKVGEVVVAKPKRGLVIKCGKGFVAIDKIQAENGKVLNIKDFLNGKGIDEGGIINE